MKQKKQKIRKFFKDNGDIILWYASLLAAGASIGYMGYMIGETITTLKIGRGLAIMQEEDILEVTDLENVRPIECLKEFQSIARYARSKKIET